MWELDHNKGWVPKNWCFKIVVLEKTLESPCIARRSNQSILKEINPEYSFEGLMLKLQYFGKLMWRANSWKRPWCWERSRAGERGDRGWDGWVPSLTQWTWTWANSSRQLRIEDPGVLQSMGFQRTGHNWVTELSVGPTVGSAIDL